MAFLQHADILQRHSTELKLLVHPIGMLEYEPCLDAGPLENGESTRERVLMNRHCRCVPEHDVDSDISYGDTPSKGGTEVASMSAWTGTRVAVRIHLTTSASDIAATGLRAFSAANETSASAQLSNVPGPKIEFAQSIEVWDGALAALENRNRHVPPHRTSALFAGTATAMKDASVGQRAALEGAMSFV